MSRGFSKPKAMSKMQVVIFSIRNLKSLLPGQAEFEFRTPRVQNRNQIVKFHRDGGMLEAP